MKIVSINLEGTDKLVSANLEHPDKPTRGVAFNLDQPLSPDAQEKLTSRLDHNRWSFEVHENCLTVTTKGKPIDGAAVIVINHILKNIEQEEQEVLQERKKALQAIAEETQLDFDKPLESLQR